ncbi:MAG TPA: archease [Noviherbaspirillum sp.]
MRNETVDAVDAAAWEHFRHGADIGIRGQGATRNEAFEQAAVALTAIVTRPARVRPLEAVTLHCQAGDDEFLFMDWINAVIFEMATRNMLFRRFEVTTTTGGLRATAWGEQVDVARHHPAVEPKGATFTELKVCQTPGGRWTAQCVVDV